MTDSLLDSIRAALASDASAETRAAGASACRTIMTALEATPGAPLGGAVPTVAPNPLAAAIAGIVRSTPPEQLLDLVIAKLGSLAPQTDAAPAVHSMHKFSIPLVKVPR
jgi:hypothetical protein